MLILQVLVKIFNKYQNNSKTIFKIFKQKKLSKKKIIKTFGTI